jgi:hypothetical protein
VQRRTTRFGHAQPSTGTLPGVLPRSGLVATLLFALLVLAGCAGEPPASFDPTGACSADGSAPGAYPELEARIPKTFHDAAPGTLDSGRNCSPAAMGSLTTAGIKELRFGGGTWSFGAERTLALAVFAAPGLTADLVGDFYASSADAAGRTTILGQSSPTIAGRHARRLDTKTSERLQSVVVWPAADPDMVNVVITNDLPEDRIQEAIAAFGEG